jgi:sugar phosphate isomerase/epimerase
MRLSVTSWSFPACTLKEVTGIAKAIGIEAIDVGLFYRSALDKSEILASPESAADGLRELGVQVANYYHLFGDGLEERNLALASSIEENLRDLEKVLTFADCAGIGSVFILPGIINPGQSREGAAKACAAGLKPMLDLAKGHKAQLCIEPHVHSWAESPTLVRRLIDETGIGLVLDYAHFACLGYRQEEIDKLAPYAVHVHLRQARMGALQARLAEGTLNFPAMFATLRDAGYSGWLAIEYVHQNYMNTLNEDVLTETIAMRDCFHGWQKEV